MEPKKVSFNQETAKHTEGHNDRSLYKEEDEIHGEAIHLYDCYDCGSSVEAERRFYEDTFMERLVVQNERSIKMGHVERVMDMKQYRAKHMPKEAIVQLGCVGNSDDVEDYCYESYELAKKKIEAAGGIVISCDLHLEERTILEDGSIVIKGTPHIHIRYAFVHQNEKDGLPEINVKKTMLEHGVPLPMPEKKISKVNSPLMFFTNDLRTALEDLADEYETSRGRPRVDRTRSNRSHSTVGAYKTEQIIKTNKKRIAEQEKTQQQNEDAIAQQLATQKENENKIAKQDAMLKENEEELEADEKLIEANERRLESQSKRIANNEARNERQDAAFKRNQAELKQQCEELSRIESEKNSSQEQLDAINSQKDESEKELSSINASKHRAENERDVAISKSKTVVEDLSNAQRALATFFAIAKQLEDAEEKIDERLRQADEAIEKAESSQSKLKKFFNFIRTEPIGDYISEGKFIDRFFTMTERVDEIYEQNNIKGPNMTQTFKELVESFGEKPYGEYPKWFLNNNPNELYAQSETSFIPRFQQRIYEWKTGDTSYKDDQATAVNQSDLEAAKRARLEAERSQDGRVMKDATTRLKQSQQQLDEANKRLERTKVDTSLGSSMSGYSGYDGMDF